MPIRVEQRLISAIRDNPGMIRVEVRTSERKLATEALRKARSALSRLDGGRRSAPGLSAEDSNGPKYVSQVRPGGKGPTISIDGGWTPFRVLRTIPDVIATHLEAAGVHDAVITTRDLVPDLTPLPRPGATLRLFPDPPAVGWG